MTSHSLRVCALFMKQQTETLRCVPFAGLLDLAEAAWACQGSAQFIKCCMSDTFSTAYSAALNGGAGQLPCPSQQANVAFPSESRRGTVRVSPMQHCSCTWATRNMASARTTGSDGGSLTLPNEKEGKAPWHCGPHVHTAHLGVFGRDSRSLEHRDSALLMNSKNAFVVFFVCFLYACSTPCSTDRLALLL
jgi:hypothetical protein